MKLVTYDGGKVGRVDGDVVDPELVSLLDRQDDHATDLAVSLGHSNTTRLDNCAIVVVHRARTTADPVWVVGVGGLDHSSDARDVIGRRWSQCEVTHHVNSVSVGMMVTLSSIGSSSP